MLDTDPTYGATADNTTDGATDNAAAPPAVPATPRKRTAPKRATSPAGPPPAPVEQVPAASTASADAPAPRKRAPRKAAAKKAAPAPAEPTQPPLETGTATEPAAGGDADGAAPPDPAPAKKTPRKRAAKKVTAAAPDAAADAAAEVAGSEPAGSEAATAGSEAAAPAPAKKTPRKRAAKKAVAAGEPAATPDPATASSGTDPAPAEPVLAPAVPSVLFVAPTEEAPAPRRRRTAKAAAASANDAPAADAPAADAPAAETPAAETAAAETAAAETQGTGAAQVPADATEDATADGDTAEADADDVREAAIEQANSSRRRRRRGRRGRGGAARGDDEQDDDTAADTAADTPADTPADTETASADDDDRADGAESDDEKTGGSSTRRRRRRRRSGGGSDADDDDPPNTVTHVRDGKRSKGSGGSGGGESDDGVKGVKGSTRLEAKRQRRRDGRDTTRRRAPILTEAEFLARREAVDRVMAVRQHGDRTQIAVLEDDILVEHYVTRASSTSYVGNVYLGRVQNVLPSMEAAFVDIGKGRNGVLYAGEVNWDAAGLEGKSRTIEHALKSGDAVLVQVTKDPIGHKGARLTSQISLPGRFVVYVPDGGMTGISRRLPDAERHRLKAILKKIVPDEAGVIVRTAAEGAAEDDLTRDVERLQAQWEQIKHAAEHTGGKKAPLLLHGEPDIAIRVVRDVFNEDFKALVVEGDEAWATVSEYVEGVAPDLAARVSRHTADTDLFHDLRVDEQLMKALDRKVWLPSGGSLVIDRTEAMTVVDVNTGKFIGSGGNLEQTVTRNNLEAAEEIVRQLRLRDVGGIVVIDFIDMVLESNRDLVLRRLTECLGRDRTKHQVAEVTSLGLVQMTRKRVGEGLLEAFSEPCEHCHGRGVIVHTEPVDDSAHAQDDDGGNGNGRNRRRRGGRDAAKEPAEVEPPASDEQRQAANAAIAAIHKAAAGGDAEPNGNGRVETLASQIVAAAAERLDPPAETPAETATERLAEPAVEPTDAAPADPTGGAPAETPANPPSPAPSAPVQAPAEPAPVAVAVDGAASDEPAPAPRRRRRAASRPAGPPVGTG